MLPALRRMENRKAYASISSINEHGTGPLVRVASFFPFHATYWLNGHSFIERELRRAGVGFHKNDNAFIAVDDVAALQAAADRLSPQIVHVMLTTDRVLPELHFQTPLPDPKIFERSCEIGLWRLTANRISEIFGVRLNKRLPGCR